MSPNNLITGGAGFIGSNLAHRLLSDGEKVILFDNLSRPNVQRNVTWLRDCFGGRAELCVGDVRDQHAVREAVSDVDNVFHLAGQVAVTASLAQPLKDFEVNARGTLNLLEAVRARTTPPPVFFASTSKVYGGLSQVALCSTERGYQPLEKAGEHGIGEDLALDFHNPHACSKGCADQYVRDYARSFGLESVVFRMSCIYGPRQFGTEDQGWVAHFMSRALRGEPITIYGDGQQTRDLLYVTDLVEAFLAARARLDICSGHVFNIGGGRSNCVSLRQVLDRISLVTGAVPQLGFEGWRTGDQPYYVSDTRKFTAFTGWRPRVGVEEGLVRLAEWLEGTAALAPASQPASALTGPLGSAALEALESGGRVSTAVH